MSTTLEYLAAIKRALTGEKRIEQVSLRVPAWVVQAAKAQALAEDRAWTDVLARIVIAYYAGNLPTGMFSDSVLDGQSFRDSQRGALGDGR